jgi:CheY-like chemotaxis protein
VAQPKALRVLVVDDETAFGEALESVLGMVGCEVDVAGTPYAGIMLSDAVRYDLVLVDQRMPQMSGLELLPRLQRRGHRCMLLVTGFPGDVTSEQARAAGAQGVVPKPVDVQRLVEIARYLAQKPGRKPVALPEALLRFRLAL